MLLVALSTIYQGKKPVINYTTEHAYVLSRAHLHYELTGELLPSVKDIVEILMLQEVQVSYFTFICKVILQL
jgi:hypothetical protein